MPNVRLHKWLATHGIASRRNAERMITAGAVEVNGQVEKTLGRQIDPSKDRVKVNGKPVSVEAPNSVYWVMHKPDAVLTTAKDPIGRPTIFDLDSLRRVPFRLFPVGRLDFRTEGLLLLSNDGEWVHRLMHPSYHVPRTYDVLVPQKLRDSQLERFSSGVHLSDGKTGPIEIHAGGSKNLGKSRGYRYRVTVHEGRNRLVRRVFEKVGVRIIRLVRVSYGPIRLTPDFLPGEVRPLTADQIARLKQFVGMAAAPPSARKPQRKRKPSKAAPNPSGSRRKPAPKQPEVAAP